MTYQLNTLRLATAYDDALEPLVIPGVAATGSSPALCVLDGANRAPHKVARLVRQVALLGIRVADPVRGARVSLTLRADENTFRMWSRAHLDENDEPLLPDDFGRHRLVEVSAQGITRSVSLLVRRPNSPAVQCRLEFDLTPDEIESGILMFGFELPGFRPAWAEDRLMPDGLTGLCVAEVRVEPIQEPLGWTISAGQPHGARPGRLLPRPGFLLLNPGSSPSPAALSFRPLSAQATATRRGRIIGRLKSMRGVGESGDGPLPPVSVEAVTVTGREILADTLTADQGEYTVHVPECREPVYVRVHAPGHPGQEWMASVRSV